ncbi:hypothetical protein [Streptomyces melanogenes]|uniref:hypothetical protein n=1 Tax=Streptomyces melanogenes TaxID=67326 RepID=UPI00167C4842|nr:hypothetical protein [Streptomyces melanogenes]GGP93297.1 hypothetical protein GCM10010278_84090 [Streptomyces melanogenes]
MRLTRPSLPSPRPAASTPVLTLPPAFEAFYATHVCCYQAYARAHFAHPGTADAVVRTAFGDLLAHWSAIVAASNPTAEAWARYSAHIRRHAPSLPLRSDARLQYQAVVLHHIVGCSVGDAAATTGEDPSKIRHMLQTWRVSGGVRSI